MRRQPFALLPPKGDLHMDSLAIALPVFLVSAAIVVAAGIGLARFGDELADHTGWGTLWVGTILVSIATSLPELVTNISAVGIGTPALALGNVLGANMINMFTVSLVALIFGVRHIFDRPGRSTQFLMLTAIAMAVAALVGGVTGDLALGPFSIGGLVVLALYIGGMRLVYRAEQAEPGDDSDREEVTGSARRAWLGFIAASLVILVSAPFLALSADGIASATGLSASFLGVLAVSIVTTLPEASVSFTAARRRSYGLVVGNIYGSCAFNLFIIPIIDLMQRDPILRSMGPEHLAAAGAAIGLMAMGLLVLRSYRARAIAWLKAGAPAIVVAYPATLFLVFILAQD